MTENAHKRFNASFLADHERRILITLARHLPTWTTPDQLTWFGIFGACIVMAGGWLSHFDLRWLWLSNLGLFVHWFGDSLDGTLARYRRIERPRYGFYLDQVIDTLGSLLIGLGVGFCPAVHMELSLLITIVFQMLAIQVYVRTILDREFHMAVGGLGPTEMRLGILAMNLGIMWIGTPALPGLPKGVNWEDIVMSATIAGLLLLFGAQMRAHLRALEQEEIQAKI